jgi:predicted branched-subunit amino acid permease
MESADEAQPGAAGDRPPGWSGVVRNALGVGLATGAYGVSFGAISTAAGLSVGQTCALSLLMFTGGSQFAFVAAVGAGGAPLAGAASAVLLSTRNALYGLRMSTILQVRGARRLVAAQLVIDESAAMAVGQDEPQLQRLGFWATGTAVFGLWNLGTALGAFGASALSDPKVFGFDAAAPAAFLALLAPRMRGSEPWRVAASAAFVAVLSTPFVPTGVPLLLAALTAAGLARWGGGHAAPGGEAQAEPA